MNTQTLFFVKKFLALAIVIITLVVGTVFISFHLRTENLTENVMLQQGRALFSQLILTRRWISQHGGIFVKVGPGVDPNPYLTTLPSLKVNLKDEDGTRYTMRNPGLVVRGLSELAEDSGQFSFHVASLEPINKLTNSPDPFEKEALVAFDAGTKQEAFTIEKREDGHFYRYMAPLVYEDKCNKCHSSENLSVGDIRGGISVSIPMAMINEKLKANRSFTVFSAITILGVLFSCLFFISRRFIGELKDAHTQLLLKATTDDLTGLYNRRIGWERLSEEVSEHIRQMLPLSCIMIDIDHFKSTNDRYGHLAGDAVLQNIAGILQRNTRKYDIACRYGGEEFLLVLPGTDLKSGMIAVEKIRRIINDSPTVYNDEVIKSTISIGVTQLRFSVGDSVDDLIRRADEALYRAKNSGRNRMEIG